MVAQHEYDFPRPEFGDIPTPLEPYKYASNFSEISGDFPHTNKEGFNATVFFLDAGFDRESRVNRKVLFDIGTPERFDDLCKSLKAGGTSFDEIIDIYITHAHYDHAAAIVAAKRKNPRVKIHVSMASAIMLMSGDYNLTATYLYDRDNDSPLTFPKVPDKFFDYFEDGDIDPLSDTVNLEIFAAPGHSPDMHVFKISSQSDNTSRLIVSDAFLGGKSRRIGSDVELWQQTNEKLAKLGADFVYISHAGRGHAEYSWDKYIAGLEGFEKVEHPPMFGDLATPWQQA